MVWTTYEKSVTELKPLLPDRRHWKNRQMTAGEAERLLATKAVMSWHDRWNTDGNMMTCTTGVIFIRDSWSYFFVCFWKGRSGTDTHIKKGARNLKRGKDGRKQDFKAVNCKSKTKDWQVGQTSANVVWNSLRGQVSKVKVMLISEKNLEGGERQGGRQMGVVFIFG